MTVAEWLAKAESYLKSRSVGEAAANVEFLMAHALGCGRCEARLRAAERVSGNSGRRFWGLVKERGRRVPLAYVLKSQPFMGLEIPVGPEVLIPRPETEEVVEEASRLLAGRERDALRILELGTGSGCIAAALSSLFPQARIHATDISSAALRLARKNVRRRRFGGRIRFIHEDFFRPRESRRGRADLVISNPPYVPTGELKTLAREVRREPSLALDGGKDGLDAVRAIIGDAPRLLKPGGWLVLEIGSKQGVEVVRLLKSRGFLEAAVRKDAQGLDRIAEGRMGGGV